MFPRQLISFGPPETLRSECKSRAFPRETSNRWRRNCVATGLRSFFFTKPSKLALEFVARIACRGNAHFTPSSLAKEKRSENPSAPDSALDLELAISYRARDILHSSRCFHILRLLSSRITPKCFVFVLKVKFSSFALHEYKPIGFPSLSIFIARLTFLVASRKI